jgi:hypothetical protein
VLHKSRSRRSDGSGSGWAGGLKAIPNVLA